MMVGIVLMYVAGLTLSAFFGGSETGLFRVPRVRLVIDAVGGDRIARGLLWLVVRPSIFIATALVGNTLANYLVSLATVLTIHEFFSQGGTTAEILFPIMLSPILFVFGELVPKNLFFHSPSRLLRMTAPIFMVSAVLFLPVTALLWAVGKLLEWIVGESPQVIKGRLARAELKRAIEEGHEAGILRPAQRLLAQGLFAVATLTVRDSMTPAARVPVVHVSTPKGEVLRLARRQQLTAIPVETPESGSRVAGYVQVTDLYLGDRQDIGPIRQLLAIAASEPHMTALVRLQGSGVPLARVVDGFNRTVGYITPRQLTEPLLRGGI